ncbi:metallophosphoesterase family protein [Marinactinospora thermotolerans]|uniref:3',5'-cyclic AMP phosphodiesterase CpdA n=1 Tax=Marinactinospora thermotolerans DSM 45154 TaxID=1122192 RepID=A0A1T4KG66_9ACTN|nr:metallophosphoesterase [Marinactinospora thermotolerans]SJZ41400.1 3',5'-cyclic AMP phosphodiesterase CpdA [Marinactinospora thermotolerans DSM 45154]
MSLPSSASGNLLAVSDLHVFYRENRKVLEELLPWTPKDWLIVAGDVGELSTDIEWALATLAERFARVIWVPGNHELWTPRDDPLQLRGVQRYNHLVRLCRGLGITTPEDPFPVWAGAGGPVVVAPLFLLYDYSFLAPGTTTPEESLARAYETGVVCTDEMMLHPDPYPSRAAWCRARVETTRDRLAQVDPDLPTVLVNHWPLTREPTRILRYPEFAQWCGTEHSADWHVRFRAKAVVYGHLHIPRTTVEDGVPFHEVSIGYPREWQPRGGHRGLRRILPAEGA